MCVPDRLPPVAGLNSKSEPVSKCYYAMGCADSKSAGLANTITVAAAASSSTANSNGQQHSSSSSRDTTAATATAITISQPSKYYVEAYETFRFGCAGC